MIRTWKWWWALGALLLATSSPAVASRADRLPARAECPRGTVATFCGCQPRDKPLTWADCV